MADPARGAGRRVVKVLDLVDDQRMIDEYRRRHAPGAVWPEVLEYLRATGILDMEIWGAGTRLVMILNVTMDFPRDIGEPARVAEWETLMARFQRPIAGMAPGGKWSELARVFTLDPVGES